MSLESGLMLAGVALVLGYFGLVRRQRGQRMVQWAWNLFPRRPQRTGGKQPKPARSKSARKGFPSSADLKELIMVAAVFGLLWIPRTLCRGLWEWITLPMWRDSIDWFVGPEWWWFAIAVSFWVAVMYERRSRFSFLLPSRHYQEGFPSYQIGLFWLTLVASSLVVPYLVWVPLRHHLSWVVIYGLWLGIQMVSWGFSIPTGRGICVLFFERPFQDRHEPGLTFFFTLNPLAWVFSWVRLETASLHLFRMFMVLPIDTEDHDPDQEKLLQFRMRLGGRNTQAMGSFTFRWRIVDFGKFLRRVKPEDLLAAARQFTVPRYQELVEFIWASLGQSADKYAADFAKAERARLKIATASSTAELEDAQAEAERLEEEAISAYRTKVEDRMKSELNRYGVEIYLFMGWDFPDDYAKAQAESAAKGAVAKGDTEVLEEVAKSVAGRPTDKTGKAKKPGPIARFLGWATMMRRISTEGGKK